MNLAFIWVRKTLHNPTSTADFCGKRQTEIFPQRLYDCQVQRTGMWVGRGIHFQNKNLKKWLFSCLACGKVTLLRLFGETPNFEMLAALWMDHHFFQRQGFSLGKQTNNKVGRNTEFMRLYLWVSDYDFLPLLFKKIPTGKHHSGLNGEE